MTGLIDALGRQEVYPSAFTRRLTLSIMAGSAFGQYMDWSGISFNPNKPIRSPKDVVSSTTSFAPILLTFANHLYALLLLPAWLLNLLPSPELNAVGYGKQKFEVSVRNASSRIRERKEEAEPQVNRRSDVLSNLVNAPPSLVGGQFSDEDIVANVFILSIAAQDTTSGTLEMGLVLLAMHPDVQESLQAEVDAICAGKTAGEAMNYKKDWPKMRNLMAFAASSLLLIQGIC